MKPSTAALFVVAAALAPLVAQSPAARKFLPQDHKTLLFVDFAKLRDRGIWDDLEASMLKQAFGKIESHLGSPLDAIDRLTTVFLVTGQADMSGPTQTVLAIEGNAALGVPEDCASWATEKVGSFEVRRGGREALAQPTPKLLVRGTAELVTAGLDEHAVPGLPSPDVMSLISGRGDLLIYMVFELANPQIGRGFRQMVMPEAQWPEGDEPHFLAMMIRSTGEADDPHLEFEAILRHTKAGPGLDATVAAGTKWLERLRDIPQLRAAKKVLERIVTKRDHGDFLARVDLGRSRDAVGSVVVLMAPMIVGSVVEPVESEAVVEEPPPPPPAAEQPK